MNASTAVAVRPVLSPSMISTWLTCPLLWKGRYVDKVKRRATAPNSVGPPGNRDPNLEGLSRGERWGELVGRTPGRLGWRWTVGWVAAWGGHDRVCVVRSVGRGLA